jgi:hypothetical protein
MAAARLESRSWLRKLFPLAFLIVAAASGTAAIAETSPQERVRQLLPLWKANAPLCEGAPSGESCHDGDMTLFNGLLCAAGEPLGCESVRKAQDSTGRWHRSVRFARDPSLRRANSFSWDMAIGVQLYVATTGDKPALTRWLSWIEEHRPCLAETPVAIDGRKYCLIRGLPRWCTDDTEMGCTGKPNDLATLATTVRALGIQPPPPAETKLSGWQGVLLDAYKTKEVREANAVLSLRRLLDGTETLQPTALVIDAAVNREGYPRHLVGAEILLMRRLGKNWPELELSALVLARKEPQNPFFQWLANGDADSVALQLLAVAPADSSHLPASRRDWTWQRAAEDEAWRRSMLWDHVFLGKLVAP